MVSWFGPMIADWRLAEALQIQKLYGGDAALWVSGRISALASAGDAAGVHRFTEIADRLGGLLHAASMGMDA